MIYNKDIYNFKRSYPADQGKSFYKESPEESLELSSYNVAVEENIFGNSVIKLPS
jgi:hypothetical protein